MKKKPYIHIRVIHTQDQRASVFLISKSGSTEKAFALESFERSNQARGWALGLSDFLGGLIIQHIKAPQ